MTNDEVPNVERMSNAECSNDESAGRSTIKTYNPCAPRSWPGSGPWTNDSADPVPRARRSFNIRASSFSRHSSFVIRHFACRRLSPFPCAALLFFSGCGPRGDIQITAQPGTRDDYALVLFRVASGDKINSDDLSASRPLLDRYLALAAGSGPESAPAGLARPPDRLAFLINAHNAAVLRSIIELAAAGAPPQSLPIDFDRRFTFLIDGRRHTIASLRDEILRHAEGDWRVRLALYGGRLDGPPLPREPFTSERLDEQLDRTVRAALASEQVVRIDHGEYKRLLLWTGLYEIKDRLIADYERRYGTTHATILSVLLEWSDGFRRQTLNAAVGYPVAAMPSDRRLNAVEPPPMGLKILEPIRTR